MVIFGVLAGHALLLLALLTVCLVEERKSQALHTTQLVLIPLAVINSEQRHFGEKGSSDSTRLPDYHWVTPRTSESSNAITIHISPYVAREAGVCPKAFRPGTPEWKARCNSAAAGEGVEFDASLSRELNLQHRGQWEVERRARNEPLVVPCGYIHTFPALGGPPPPPVKMVNLGCAAKHLFGR
jgi:hypothetical protein